MSLKRFFVLFITFLIAVLITGCTAIDRTKDELPGTKLNKAGVVRVGYFPNITHSQAIIGLANGEFKNALGKKIQIETKQFNAGPAEIEALFADEIDIGYIGPNPAINGFIMSQGEALKIIAGATSGGAALVVRKDLDIKNVKDLYGKKIASPQLGNTQDIALRFYLKKNGLKLKGNGGRIEIKPTENPDILTLFKKKEIDGAWVPEPWASRLVKQANGRIFLDERKTWPNGEFVTTNVIVSQKFLKENPKIVKKWLRGHIQTTLWINKNKSEAKNILNNEIKKISGKGLPEDVLDDAFSRITVTWDPIKTSLFKSALSAYKLGFIKSKNINGIYDLRPINKILKEDGLKEIT